MTQLHGLLRRFRMHTTRCEDWFQRSNQLKRLFDYTGPVTLVEMITEPQGHLIQVLNTQG